MNKTFQCGRLMISEDGILKAVDLQNGGGSRRFHLQHDEMDFNTVKKKIINIYQIDDHKYKTTLYDYKCQPLNINKYGKVSEYIDRHGLNGRQKILYICTSEVDNNDDSKRIMSNKKNSIPIKTSTIEQKSCIMEKVRTPTKSMVKSNCFSRETHFHEQPSFQCLSEYSFANEMNSMVENIRDLIKKIHFDKHLVKLLENLSIIHGYAITTIDPLKNKIKHSEKYDACRQNDVEFNEHYLNHVNGLCQTTEILIQSNETPYYHMPEFLTTVNSFNQFYYYLKILLNKWFDKVEEWNSKLNTTILLSSLNSSNLKSIPSKSNILLSSCESSTKKNYEEFILFESILNCLTHLSSLLYPQYLIKFRQLIQSTMINIEFIRSTISLNDEQSLTDAIKNISSIKYNINKSIYEQNINYFKCGLDRELDTACKKTLKAIKILLTSINHYRMQVNQQNRREHSNWSSPPRLLTD